MTVRNLIEALQTCRPDAQVVLSKDAEGNRVSPVDSYDEGLYTPSSTWAGEFVCYGDAPEGETISAVCLWPVN